MSRQAISAAELPRLPVSTLGRLALALARDVDRGEDKAHTLEAVLRAIAAPPREGRRT